MMKKFYFLPGNWDLEYHIRTSPFSEAATGSGTGTFKRTLDEKYVVFDYPCNINNQKGQAHGIFA